MLRSLVSLTVFIGLVAAVVFIADRQGHLSVRDWIASTVDLRSTEPIEANTSTVAESGSSAPPAPAPLVEERTVDAPAVDAATGAISTEPPVPEEPIPKEVVIFGPAPAADDGSRAIEPPADAQSGASGNVLGDVPGEALAEASPGPDRPAVRAIAPSIVAPPELDAAELDRAEPREPLSKLSLALPPSPETVDDWDGTTLFRPIAPAAGLVEAMGYSVSVAGADVLPAGQTCEHKGRKWDCGTRARTAFRGFLRGRAVICALPEGAAKGALSAPCRIGKQNLGKWLVANGWAPAASGGPYAELGNKAREAGKGIYGSPPDMAEVGPVQVLRDLTPPVSLPMPAR